MKKFHNIVLIAAGAALLFAACQKDNERTVTLNAVVADQPNLGGDAKVYVNETGGVVYGCWQQNDSVLLNDEGHQVVVNSPSSTYPETFSKIIYKDTQADQFTETFKS